MKDPLIEKWEYEDLEEVPGFKKMTYYLDSAAERSGRNRWEHSQVVVSTTPGKNATEYTRTHKNIRVNKSIEARNRSIRFDYTFRFMNVRDLALKYGISEKTVYSILWPESRRRRFQWRRKLRAEGLI